MINYNNKIFRVVQNSDNGEVTQQMKFHYHQADNIVTSNYSGGSVRAGHLIALVRTDGSLDMRYHHINSNGQIMTGICESIPEVLENGKIRLHEKWRWTSDPLSDGQSTLEEE